MWEEIHRIVFSRSDYAIGGRWGKAFGVHHNRALSHHVLTRNVGASQPHSAPKKYHSSTVDADRRRRLPSGLPTTHPAVTRGILLSSIYRPKTGVVLGTLH